MLSILNFNLWNNSLYKKQRIDWFIKRINIDRPDVILLQEVNNSVILDLISLMKELKYEYFVSNTRNNSYEMICSHFRLLDYNYCTFSNSLENKGLLWADINYKGKIITIATSQLEQSINNDKKRLLQLDCSLTFLSKKPLFFFGCDTGSFHNKIDLKNKFYDTWELSGENNFTEYTYDYKINKYIDDNIQARPDRLFTNKQFKDINFNLIGYEKISKDINPSIRLGILLKIFIK